MNDQNRLANFPISFFSIVMGLAGFTIAWEKAQHVFETSLGVTPVLVGLTSLVFIVLLLIYATKLFRFPANVLKELKHPVKLSFFPSISISFLLLAIAYLDINPAISHPLWIIGAVMHLGFTLYVISSWMHHEHFQINHINPAWFIPAVGNVLVPVAGVTLGYQEVSWFYFSIGILFWVILLTIFFNRILFHNPMDTHLLPTLFILIAPPAVGFIAYIRLNGALDNFAHFIYYGALFFTVLLLFQAARFVRLPFFLSWWAYSFPLAAITIASFLMHKLHGNEELPIFLWIASTLLVLLTLVVSIIIWRTVQAILRHGICVPE